MKTHYLTLLEDCLSTRKSNNDAKKNAPITETEHAAIQNPELKEQVQKEVLTPHQEVMKKNHKQEGEVEAYFEALGIYLKLVAMVIGLLAAGIVAAPAAGLVALWNWAWGSKEPAAFNKDAPNPFGKTADDQTFPTLPSRAA
jgi:hypothetical protein